MNFELQMHRPDPEGEAILKGIKDVSTAETAFLNACSELAMQPSYEHCIKSNELATFAQNSFLRTVQIIIEAEETENSEKSAWITALVMRSDKARINHFQSLAPDTKFSKLPMTYREFSELTAEYLDHDDPGAITELYDIIFEVYADNLQKDSQSLWHAICETPKGKKLAEATNDTSIDFAESA